MRKVFVAKEPTSINIIIDPNTISLNSLFVRRHEKIEGEFVKETEVKIGKKKTKLTTIELKNGVKTIINEKYFNEIK